MLSQKSYIDSILHHYGFEDLNPISTPMDPSNQLTSAQSPSTTEEFAAMQNIPYHKAVGSLMYAMLGTRPDICFAVQTVSHFNSKPRLPHWEAIKLDICRIWLQSTYCRLMSTELGDAMKLGCRSQGRAASWGLVPSRDVKPI